MFILFPYPLLGKWLPNHMVLSSTNTTLTSGIPFPLRHHFQKFYKCQLYVEYLSLKRIHKDKSTKITQCKLCAKLQHILHLNVGKTYGLEGCWFWRVLMNVRLCVHYGMSIVNSTTIISNIVVGNWLSPTISNKIHSSKLMIMHRITKSLVRETIIYSYLGIPHYIIMAKKLCTPLLGHITLKFQEWLKAHHSLTIGRLIHLISVRRVMFSQG